jgi:hypothetical protein
MLQSTVRPHFVRPYEGSGLGLHLNIKHRSDGRLRDTGSVDCKREIHGSLPATYRYLLPSTFPPAMMCFRTFSGIVGRNFAILVRFQITFDG